MIPIVNGKQEWFGARGLYDGLVLIADETTGSYWNHITGECVHGELQGYQLEFSDHNLLYTTVEAALQSHPDAHLAYSRYGLKQGVISYLMNAIPKMVEKVVGDKRLPPRFLGTMGQEDTRLERLSDGLGVWSDTTHRYYPLDTIQGQPDGILDTFDERCLFVYYNADAKAPDAVFIETKSVRRDGDTFVFDNSDRLQNGILTNAQGETQTIDRPQQMFSRWYGFSYTFPGCEIYGR